MKCDRCGTDNPAEVHTCSPLALKLADQLDMVLVMPLEAAAVTEAAAELRRLHAENDELRGMYVKSQFEVGDVRSENEALREALTRLCQWAEADKVNYTGDHPVAQARAAIAALRERLDGKR
jgi:hypothetical protein